MLVLRSIVSSDCSTHVFLASGCRDLLPDLSPWPMVGVMQASRPSRASILSSQETMGALEEARLGQAVGIGVPYCPVRVLSSRGFQDHMLRRQHFEGHASMLGRRCKLHAARPCSRLDPTEPSAGSWQASWKVEAQQEAQTPGTGRRTRVEGHAWVHGAATGRTWPLACARRAVDACALCGLGPVSARGLRCWKHHASNLKLRSLLVAMATCGAARWLAGLPACLLAHLPPCMPPA